MANEWGKTPQGETAHAYNSRATEGGTTSLCRRSAKAESITYADPGDIRLDMLCIKGVWVRMCETCRKKEEAGK